MKKNNKLKKRVLFLFIASLLTTTGFSQVRNCATMEVLNKQIQEDSTLKKKMDSLEVAKQEWIKASGYYEDYSQLSLPIIPDFVPTGDPKTDVTNFLIAKEKLYNENPELYRKLTRNDINKNKTR